MRLSIFCAALVIACAIRPDFDVGGYPVCGILYFFGMDLLEWCRWAAPRDKELGGARKEA